jgi:hypothetical protein
MFGLKMKCRILQKMKPNRAHTLSVGREVLSNQLLDAIVFRLIGGGAGAAQFDRFLIDLFHAIAGIGVRTQKLRRRACPFHFFKETCRARCVVVGFAQINDGVFVGLIFVVAAKF